MSIDSDVEVMRAKLAGAKGVPSLMAMAAKGNMSAAIALKEIKDAEDAKAAMQRQAGIQMDMPAGSVLSGLAAEIEAQKAPMPTTPMYADGGRVRNFAWGGPGDAEWQTQRPNETNGDYGLRMEAGPNYNKVNPDSFGADVANLFGKGKDALLEWMRKRDEETNKARMSQRGTVPGVSTAADAADAADNSGREHLRKTPADPPVAKPKPKAKTPGAGLADAVTDEMRADDRQPRPSLQGQAAAAPQTPEDIYAAKLEKLREEGKKLSAEQQKLLDEAHARTKERLKGDGIWGILRHIGAQAGTKNGGRAMNAFAAGTREYNKEEKDRKGLVDKADDLHAQNTLLLKKADLLAAEGDLKGAYELRNQAAKNAQEMELKKAQTRMYNANADAKPEEAAAKVTAANRPRGAGGAGGAKGAKPLTYKDALAAAAKSSPGAPITEITAIADSLMQADAAQRGAATIPGNAQPGAQTGKVLDFNAI